MFAPAACESVNGIDLQQNLARIGTEKTTSFLKAARASAGAYYASELRQKSR